MKLLKYFLFIAILIVSLFFFVRLDDLNMNTFNEPVKIKIPFLVDNPTFEMGFDVWIVILGTLSLGVVIGFLLALLQIISQKSDLIKTRSKLKKLQIELDGLRNQAINDDIEITDDLTGPDELKI